MKRDSFTCVVLLSETWLLHVKTHLRTHHLMTWQDKRIIHMRDAFYCDMTHVYEYACHCVWDLWHEAWLICMCQWVLRLVYTNIHVTWSVTHLHVSMRLKTHVYEYTRYDMSMTTTYAMKRDLFTCVVLLSETCLFTRKHTLGHTTLWLDKIRESFTCMMLFTVTWLMCTNINVMTQLMPWRGTYLHVWHSLVQHDSFMYIHTLWHTLWNDKMTVVGCGVSHSHVRYFLVRLDSFIRIHTTWHTLWQDTKRDSFICVMRDSFTCVILLGVTWLMNTNIHLDDMPWLIHTCKVTSF